MATPAFSPLRASGHRLAVVLLLMSSLVVALPAMGLLPAPPASAHPTSAYHFGDGGIDKVANHPDWMGQLMDEKPDMSLSDLAIPGTHDSAAYLRNAGRHDGFTLPWVATQTMDIENQLMSGIRFLDIRVKQHQEHGSRLQLYHGEEPLGTVEKGEEVDSFFMEDVLEPTVRFLETHTDETVYMRLQLIEGDRQSAFDAYSSILNTMCVGLISANLEPDCGPKYREYVWADFENSTDPRLSQTSGKIVILDDNLTETDTAATWIGLAWNGLCIHDFWANGDLHRFMAEKYMRISGHLHNSWEGTYADDHLCNEKKPNRDIYLTFLTGSGVGYQPHSLQVAIAVWEMGARAKRQCGPPGSAIITTIVSMYTREIRAWETCALCILKA